MKKTILALGLIVALASCGGGVANEGATKADSTAVKVDTVKHVADSTAVKVDTAKTVK